MTLTGKGQYHADFRNRILKNSQQRLGCLHTLPVQVFHRAYSHFLTEQMGETVFAQSRCMGNVGEAYFFLLMVIYEIHGSAYGPENGW